MTEPRAGRLEEGASDGLSCDRWLGGRLILEQPRRGHRVGSDAALLAAAAGLDEGRLVDVGAGVGAVGLAILGGHASTALDCVEIDLALADIAAENAARNGLAARTRVIRANVLDARARRAGGLADEAADLVVTNPPFFERGAVRVSPDAGKAGAHVFAGDAGPAPLIAWVRACLALLKPGGRFAMIHRPDALPQILAATERRIGAVALLPVHPRAGAIAHRLVVSGVKGSKAPLRIAPALILHEPDGTLTAAAGAIHRGDRPIDWGE
jgi:tRNA1(Val) A37 N6-methylase TrmN6